MSLADRMSWNNKLYFGFVESYQEEVRPYSHPHLYAPGTKKKEKIELGTQDEPAGTLINPENWDAEGHDGPYSPYSASC